ncbi:MAG: carboxypeptidase regulatory-like domain-containing protein, partial [Candidatus Cloacimonetes bacterium]|nr:carboxypeptidase regulatory-like domain-containing protein [Candidatus Cloacimonadota bacterium]
PENQFELVFDGGVDLTAAGAIELTIPLQTPFPYAGDNLAIMIVRPLDGQYYGSGNTIKHTAGTNYPNRTLYYYSDSVDCSPSSPPTGYLVGNMPNVTLSMSTSGLATLDGNVTFNGNPVPGVTVTVDGTTRSATTNNQGHYEIEYLSPGTVSITASKELFNDTHIDDVVLVADETTTQDVTMSLMTIISASGEVFDAETNNPIENAVVTLQGIEDYETTTDATGAFTFPIIYSGQTYTLSVLKMGYELFREPINIGTTNHVIPTISLSPNPPIVDIIVGNPSSTSSAYYYPANFYYKSSLTQTIYMESEMNDQYYLGGGTPITSITYFANLNGDIPANKPLKIWMANTNISAFSTTSAWIPESEFTLVFDGNVDLSMSGSHEIEIDLEEPFPYDGNNLVIMVQRPLDSGYYSSLNKWKNTTTPQYANRTLYRLSDTENLVPANPGTGTLANAMPNTGFSFTTSGFATLSGTVTSGGTPLGNVKVAIQGTNRFAMTNTNGTYDMAYLAASTITLKASKNGYNDEYVENVVLIAEENTVQDISMTTMTNVTVTGQVVNSTTNEGIENAVIELIGYADYEVLTDATGAFTIPQVYSGQTYTLRALKPAFVIYSQQLVVGTNDIVVPTIELDQGPGTAVAYVGDPNSTATSYQYPINFFYKSSLSQTIYMADELSSEFYLGAGTPITSIKYFMTLGGNIPANKPLKVWMANTESSSFASTADWISIDQFTLVWDGTVDLSASGAHELEFELDEPFPYDGDNLVIMIQRPFDDAYYSTTNLFKYTTTSQYNNRMLYWYIDGSEADPNAPASGYLANTVPNTEMVFATAGFASLTGTVSDANGPLTNARVAVVGTNRFATTNIQGQYQLNYLTPGTVTLKTSCQGYNDEYTEGVVLVAEENTVQNITMTPMTNISITGFVKNATTQAGIPAAEIRLYGYEDYSVVSTNTGAF